MTRITLRQQLGWRYFQVQRALLEAGLLPARKDYTRFIILARARTGSTMLLTALASHPQTVCYGELFQKPGQMRWHPRFGHAPALVQGAEVWPAVERLVFGTYPAAIRAVGFKLFYYHARQDGWQPLWQGLQADSALHIIHVRRENMLEMIVSRAFAARRAEWSRFQRTPDAGGVRTGQIELDYESCRRTFVETRDWQVQTRAFFAAHPWLDVSYEAMATGFVSQSRRIQDFLGLDYADITPQTTKQARRALPLRVANYAELKEAFAGSEWSSFFTD